MIKVMCDRGDCLYNDDKMCCRRSVINILNNCVCKTYRPAEPSEKEEYIKMVKEEEEKTDGATG